MKTSSAQIVATLGPASLSREVLSSMLEREVDALRFNLSWSSPEERVKNIALAKELVAACGRRVPIIADLPGPRIQAETGHTYDHAAVAGFTSHDAELVHFGVAQGVDWFAVSFVAGPEDILACKEAIRTNGGTQKVIAKIERKIALDKLDSIVAAADAVMVARGDLGKDIPPEEVPFAQRTIIAACNAAGKPVITATEMLLSMKDSAVPTRAEVSDVADAILEGSDAVMLSEETAIGKHPVEAVAMMERILVEAERHEDREVKKL